MCYAVDPRTRRERGSECVGVREDGNIVARSDLIISLVRAGSRGDRRLLAQTVEALVAEERAKQHHVLADQIAATFSSNGSISSDSSSSTDQQVHGLFYEITPYKKLSDLVLPMSVLLACDELVEEQHRSDLLRSYNLEPRHRILLVGPPGNGKTSLAEAIAEKLMVPLLAVRYEGVIGSYLGETASRLAKLFDYARSRRCVLFFDEFDALGKERGDAHETGEIKRVVSSLLLQIDNLPSHVIVITATNHPELLDRAVWRRFQLRLMLPAPKRAQIENWFRRFEQQSGLSLGYSYRDIATKLLGMNFSELEEFGADIQRRNVLSMPDHDTKSIVSERIRQWQARFTLSPEREDTNDDGI